MGILKESGAEHLARLAREKVEREAPPVITAPVVEATPAVEGEVKLTPAQKAAITKAANKAKKELEEGK